MFYKYKNKVYVPIIGIGDDVLFVARCSSEALSVMQQKSHSSSWISLASLAKKGYNCLEYRLHEEPLRESHGEKYLCDDISE